MTTTQTTDMFKTMSDAFAKNLHVGVKFLEDGARFWTDAMNRNVDDYRNRCEKMFDDFSAMGKKNSDRFARFCDEQTQRGSTFVKQMAEMPVAQTPVEMFDRMGAACRTSLELMRDHADAMAKFTTDAMQNVSNGVRCCETPADAAAARKSTK